MRISVELGLGQSCAANQDLAITGLFVFAEVIEVKFSLPRMADFDL